MREKSREQLIQHKVYDVTRVVVLPHCVDTVVNACRQARGLLRLHQEKA